MEYEVAHAEEFPLELGRAKEKVRKAYSKIVLPILKKNPDTPDQSRVKQLVGFKDLWRIRISDEYRLVYRVDRLSHVVTLLMLDLRSKIYDRLGANDDGSPGIRIVARADSLLERVPTADAIGKAEIALSQTENEESNPDNLLEVELTPDLLGQFGVSEKYHQQFENAKTEGDLIGLSIPDKEIERVLNAIWPTSIEQIVQQPVRLAGNPQDLALAGTAQVSLESYLLKLDDDQRSFLKRFDTTNPKGPWLIKGGPGSGKSTMALYCIQSLIKNANEMIPGQSRPLRILFATYTKALINSSEYLLRTLGVERNTHTIDVKTVDSAATRYLDPEWRTRRCESETSKLLSLAEMTITECRRTDSSFAFDCTDAEYLLEEIQWIIHGYGIRHLKDYQSIQRSGRGRSFGSRQRLHIWRFYESFNLYLKVQKLHMFSKRRWKALDGVKPTYDYVFIDEAQDLSPVAVQFCIGLCYDPKNVFLTADSNQSIYGNVMSWSKVSSDLRFTGKARILRKNYRTTKEIWNAIHQLAPHSASTDNDTLDIQSVFSGPPPVYAKCQAARILGERLNRFLYESMRAERVGPQSVAVLCRSSVEMSAVMKLLDKKFNPKLMNSQKTDLSHPGVKVMTMHAAKGLQFPIVAVYGFSEGYMPTPPKEGADTSEHRERERRLLFVACTRAMKRLLLAGSSVHPSPFAVDITDEYWDIEEL